MKNALMSCIQMKKEVGIYKAILIREGVRKSYSRKWI